MRPVEHLPVYITFTALGYILKVRSVSTAKDISPFCADTKYANLRDKIKLNALQFDGYRFDAVVEHTKLKDTVSEPTSKEALIFNTISSTLPNIANAGHATCAEALYSIHIQ